MSRVLQQTGHNGIEHRFTAEQARRDPVAFPNSLQYLKAVWRRHWLLGKAVHWPDTTAQ